MIKYWRYWVTVSYMMLSLLYCIWFWWPNELAPHSNFLTWPVYTNYYITRYQAKTPDRIKSNASLTKILRSIVTGDCDCPSHYCQQAGTVLGRVPHAVGLSVAICVGPTKRSNTSSKNPNVPQRPVSLSLSPSLSLSSLPCGAGSN